MQPFESMKSDVTMTLDGATFTITFPTQEARALFSSHVMQMFDPMTDAALENNGKPCHYCKRVMDVRSPRLMPTKDHIHPKSQGGRRTVHACSDCNTLKADMTLDEWTLVMAANPEWWNGITARSRAFIRNWRTPPTGAPFQVIPYAESVYILKWGKKMWRAAKAAGITFPQPVSGAALAAPCRWETP